MTVAPLEHTEGSLAPTGAETYAAWLTGQDIATDHATSKTGGLK